MRVAKLKNGKNLSFPAGTSDEVIQATVKRLLNVKEELRPERVARAIEKEPMEKEEVDFYGPASKEQTEVITKVAGKIVEAINGITKVSKDRAGADKRNGLFREFIDIFKKNKVDDRDLIKTSMLDVSDSMAVIAKHIEVLTQKMNENTLMLVKAQDENTKAVNELAKAYRSPKTIVRDEEGKPKGIV